MKPEKFGKFAVEVSHRIRSWNHQHRIEPAAAPVPNRRGLPRSAAVHDHNGGFVKSRKSIRTDGMRKVMIDKPSFRFRWPELLREFLRSALLVPHTQEVQRGIQSVEVRQRHLSRGVAFQIVTKDGPRRLPAKAHFVQLFSTHSTKIQTRLNSILWKPRVMLQPADALFRHRKKKLAVAHDA